MIQESHGREADRSTSNVKTPKAFKNSNYIKQLQTEEDGDITSGADREQSEGEEGEVEQESVLSVRPLDLNEMPDFIPL